LELLYFGFVLGLVIARIESLFKELGSTLVLVLHLKITILFTTLHFYKQLRIDLRSRPLLRTPLSIYRLVLELHWDFKITDYSSAPTFPVYD
jgi:hypothetical protein